MDFQRINDQDYRFIFLDQNKDTHEVHLHHKGPINPHAYEIAKQISRYFSENQERLFNATNIFFFKKGKFFKVEHLHSHTLNLTRFFGIFFKYFKNPSKINLKIKEIKKSNSPELINLPFLNDEIALPKEILFESDYLKPAFSDGYSKIATEAFQKHEHNFFARDDSLLKNDNSQYRIVLKENVLTLVHHKKYLEIETAQGYTLHRFKDFLIKEHGKEKVEYLSFLYKIDLNALAPLTPEIVYRMNIGMGNLEKQDIDELVKKIDLLTVQLDQGTLSDETWQNEFTTQQLRGIKKLSSSETLADFKKFVDWLKEYRRLNQQQKKRLALSILQFTPEERNCQYTGKKIFYRIKSKYTLADTKFYKPWIDQQELLQTYETFENIFDNPKRINIWDAWLETLSHVIAKKHLIKSHPTDGFRVGGLIPAPPEPNGQRRWYVVSSFISNGKGIHSYTLEPFDLESAPYPIIKLFCSTSSSSYALDNLATIKNDLNPINAPGYEGAGYVKKYEDRFFRQRSIPLWVGYLMQAKKELNKPKTSFFNPLEKYKKNICQSIAAYKRHVKLSYHPKEMKAIIHTRDAELIQLAGDLMRKSLFNFFIVCRLTSIMLRYKRKKEISVKTQTADLTYLLALVKTHDKFQEFQADLLNRKSINDEMKITMSACKQLIQSFKKLYKINDYLKLNNRLEELAYGSGEHPDQKIKQSILMTGHSLGGACAQKFFVDYTAKTERIPLEGMKMSIQSFDSPAINCDDNQIYKNFGIHKKLFKNLNVRHSIVHRLEAGDFVSQGGGEHLGAVLDYYEQQDLQNWTTFEASVSQGFATSAIPEIRDASTAHATQFEKGKRNPTFIINSARKLLYNGNLNMKKKKQILQLVADRLGDYERTWVDPQILWRFNHGDRRSWKHIQAVWQPCGFFSTTVEKVRSLLGVILRILLVRVSLNNPIEQQTDKGHGEWWKLRDNNGVFAVDLENGISSRNLNAQI